MVTRSWACAFAAVGAAAFAVPAALAALSGEPQPIFAITHDTNSTVYEVAKNTMTVVAMQTNANFAAELSNREKQPMMATPAGMKKMDMFSIK